MKWIKRIVMLCVLVAAAAGIFWALQPKPVPVDVATVGEHGLLVTVDEEGRTRVKERFTVSTPLAGKLARIALDPGDRVAAGQVIARIQPSASPLLDPRRRAEAEAQVKAADARIQLARAELDEATSQFEYANRYYYRIKESDDFTEEQKDQAATEDARWGKRKEAAEFAVKVAEFELQIAQAALSRYDEASSEGKTEVMELKSPVEGVVLRTLQESEAVVSAGMPLIELGDPKALEVVAEILSTQATRIEKGDSALFVRWGGVDALHGTVRRIEPSAFTKVSALGVEEQRVNVLLDFSDDFGKWSRLRDGFRLDVQIIVDQREKALTLPLSALFRDGEQWFCFVMAGEGKASRREVEIGLRNGSSAEILKGLKQGEQVILYPGESIKDGALVSDRAKAE